MKSTALEDLKALERLGQDGKTQEAKKEKKKEPKITRPRKRQRE
jgi:hypothetical protein